MDQDNQTIPQNNVAIDLCELSRVLWQGKWIILFITTVFFGGGSAYVMLFQTQTAIFDVEPVTSYEIDDYAELNYLLRLAAVADLTPEQQTKYFAERYELEITAQVLLDLLMERVRNRQDFLHAVKELNYIPQGDKTEEEWELAIKQFVYNIQFLRPLSPEEIAKNKSSNIRTNWQIKTEGVRDQKQYKQLLELVLNKSNEFVRKGLLSKVEKRIVLLKTKQVQNTEDIDIKIIGLREAYKAKIANSIAYLKEQAQIARQLGIARSTLEAQFFNGTTGMVTTLQTEPPLYLRGYEAIEKELNLLETRTTTDEFIPELIHLNQLRRALLEDQVPQRLTQVLLGSNLAMKDTFMTATIDMNEVNFMSVPKASLIYIFSIIAGVLFSIMFIVIKVTLKKRQLK